ncbi:MAG: long-chain fatty acid--CoA ligase [Bacteroidia bacterium]|jgi:long-chain acyl-CoA synthetase|nr:long-chain fatty acid--CoA ligase [Bacteroidia bacterium]
MEVTRVFELFDRYQTLISDKPDALAGKVKGEWIKYSLKDFIRLSHELAAGFIEIGIKRGDRIGLIANNRPEWNIADFGSQLAGAVLVPVYPTISDSDLKFISEDADLSLVLLSSADLADKVKGATSELKNLKGIYSFDEVPGMKHWSELTQAGAKNPHTASIDLNKKNTKPDDLLTLLYTSGTTGTPKGVMLTHGNLVSNFTSLCKLPPVDTSCRALSFLPLNHSYERLMVYIYLYNGVSIYYAESLETIGDNMREIKPHIFTCVPRLLEKVYDRIVNKGAELKGIKHKLFFWALSLGEKFDNRPGVNGWFYNRQLALASKLIFSKWREALGGNVRAAVSGGAALNPRLARIFWAAGIPVLEGYGLTETSPVIAVNNFDPNSVRFGTVGPVIKGVEVKIAEDGEILCKGPNVMKGYYNRPEATAEVMDSEGWFHTGDIGILEEGRFLKITDRKKEIFKTSGGKYIAPQALENRLKTSRFIEQSMVIGENRKYAAALVVPAFAFIRDWASRKNMTLPAENAALIEIPEIRSRIEAEVDAINKELAQYERIKRIILLPTDWSVAGGELTPKLSLRRKIILKANEDKIEKLYSNDND